MRCWHCWRCLCFDSVVNSMVFSSFSSSGNVRVIQAVTPSFSLARQAGGEGQMPCFRGWRLCQGRLNEMICEQGRMD